MSHKKVKMACGLFDLVSPSYGRPRFKSEGRLIQHGGLPNEREAPLPAVREELAAMKDTRAFIKSVAAHRAMLAGAPLPPPRLVRAPQAPKGARFTNRAHFA